MDKIKTDQNAIFR